MNIHNLMEEYVFSHVNALYDGFEKERPAWLRCSCRDCRIDVTTYVLNRVPPRYVVSGRGVIHSKRALSDPQLRADVDMITLEGIRLINASSRPYHKGNKVVEKEAKNELLFNFPVFIGTVLDGNTFEPMSGVTVTLKLEDKIVDMFDKTWSNPCLTYNATKGVYSFLVKPLPSKEENETKKFTFVVTAEAEDYAPSIYSFDLTIVSEKGKTTSTDTSFSLKMQDMFMFRREVDNPQE